MKFLALTAALLSVSAGAMMYSAQAGWAKPDEISKNAAKADSGTMDRADDDMKDVLLALQELGPKPIETLSPAEARKQPTPSDAVALVLKKDDKDVNELKAKLKVKTQDLSYAAGKGKQAIRVYMPEDMKPDEKLPVIVYYHGGGFVIADIDVYDATPRGLASAANAIVFSAEYRHAPEHKFPAQHEDAFAAYQWVIENAGQYGGDPSRIAVVGESAGGNLAANVAIMARDKNAPMPSHMVLVYPVAGNDINTESYVENANAKPLNKAMMEWFVKNTIKTDADKNDPRINLLGANLKGLPSATVITAEIDPLRSEGELLAKKLEEAGSKVDYENYEGVTHEFFGMAFAVKDAKAAQGKAVANLKSAFEDVEDTADERPQEKAPANR